ATAQIVAAIERANRDQRVDSLIVSRGGGSLEDLWCFNEEAVAQAIFQSRLPVISAVGHEVDFTIADFVADVRAATPSAAAELLSRDCREQAQQLSGWSNRLLKSWQRVLTQQQQRLHWLQSRLQHPGQRLRQWSLRLDELDLRLRATMLRRLREQRQHVRLFDSQLHKHNPLLRIGNLRDRFDSVSRQLGNTSARTLQAQQQRLNAVAQLLHSVSPLPTLQRGYAIVSNDAGEVLRDASHVEHGATVRARLAHGQLICTVTSTLPENY